MKPLYEYSIKSQLRILTILFAIPPLLLIVFSAYQQRNEAIRDSIREIQALTYNISAAQNSFSSSIMQLSHAISQLQEVKNHDPAATHATLTSIHAVNPQYGNIIITDMDGNVWASARPIKSKFSMAAIRTFYNCKASKQFSSGEYVVGKVSSIPTIGFGYPILDEKGNFKGAICININFEHFIKLLRNSNLPNGSSYRLIDHNGTVIFRYLEPEKNTGIKFQSSIFNYMQLGPESEASVGVGSDGIKKVISYRKLTLPGESEPYLYIRAGIPYNSVVSGVNKSLTYNLAGYFLFLIITLSLSFYVGRYLFVDRIQTLKSAASSMAQGDIKVRISSNVTGGELGELAKSFDHMAEQIEQREVTKNESLQELQESEQRFRLLADSAPVLIWMSDYSKKCTYFNKGWLDFTGHSLEEVIGDGWADDVHPDDLLVCVKTYEESFDKRQNFSMEYRLQRHDGEYRWVLDIGVPRYFANGEFAGYIGSCIDITDHKNLEEQILHSRKVDSIGRLAGGVAHDFNNKLTVILGYSQLSLMMITEENELWNNLIEIEKAAQLSQDITRQLLSFSRQEMVSPIVINLNLLISGSEKAISRIIGEDVTIFINLEENLWNVMIDPSQVDQILMNLSANARDAMPEGGKISISTSNIQLDDEFCRRHPTARQGEYVHLSFRDTGLGIDPVLLHKIFDPYFTTKDIGKGTGLGLATIHGIVSQNDGFISVASEPHTGTTFDIYFPRTELIDTNDSPTTNNINKHPGAILLVEDDRDVRKLAAIMLRELGYDVISAHSPDEAIDICRDNEIMINAILSDVIMPAMNGLEMMKRIEEIRPSLKVLFMSGYTSDILSPKGIVLDKINVVQKPLNMKTLAIKLRELMA